MSIVTPLRSLRIRICTDLYASACSWVIRPRVLQEPVELNRQGLDSGIRLNQLKCARLSCNEGTRERDGSREIEEVSSCKGTAITQLLQVFLHVVCMLSFPHLQRVKFREHKT